MRFADDLFHLYLRHFDNNEQESLELFIQSVLEQMDEQDLLEIFRTCNKDELNHMLVKYLRSDIENKLKYDRSAMADENQISI